MGTELKRLCKKICGYIWEKNPNELSGITASSISDKFEISKNEFLKKFRETVGVSFSDFVDFVKLRRAEALLKARPDLTVKEISMMVGIKKRQRFSEKFKKKYGLTPNEYRKLHR